MKRDGGEWRSGYSIPIHSFRLQEGRKDDYSMVNQYANDHFFHKGQQSVNIQEDQQKRSRLMVDQKRLADLHKYKIAGKIPERLPMVEMKKDRYTLCMEVPGVEHLQASKSASTGMAALLKESSALIKLPEKDPDNTQLISQVTITGSLHEVEHVRRRIRDMGTISVTIPLQKSAVSLSSAGEWLASQLEGGHLPFPSLVFSLRQATPMLDVVGASTEEAAMQSAVSLLLERLYKEDGQAAEVYTTVEVSSAYRKQMSGNPDGSTMVAITRETGATIHFPTAVHPSFATYTIVCSGRIHCILHARRMLLGLLPAQLCWDTELPEESEMKEDDRSRQYYVKEHNFTIRVEKSELEPLWRMPTEKMRHFTSVCTSEYNVNALYSIGSNSGGLPPPAAPIFQLFTPSVQSVIATCMGPIYAPCRVFPRDIGRRLREEVACPLYPTDVPPRRLSVNAEDRVEKSRSRRPSANFASSPVAVMGAVGGRESDQSNSHSYSSRSATAHSNPSVTLLQLQEDGVDGEWNGDRKCNLEQNRSARPKDTPKHTLQLRSSNHRQHAPRESDQPSTPLVSLPLKERRHKEEEEKEDAEKDSYAQVLQKTTGRMDPMQLIALAGEECELEEAMIEEPPTQRKSTYAAVAGSVRESHPSSLFPSERGSPSSTTWQEDLVYGEWSDTSVSEAGAGTSDSRLNGFGSSLS